VTKKEIAEALHVPLQEIENLLFGLAGQGDIEENAKRELRLIE